MDSFPSFFKLPSSVMTSQSPFPPLKVEHRYRGVYERAGFDVCRSPLPSPNSPNFPKGFQSDVRMTSSPAIVSNEAMQKGTFHRCPPSSATHDPYQQSPQRRPAPSSRNFSAPDANRDLRNHLDRASLEHDDSTLSNKYRTSSTSLRDSQEKNASSSLVATSASLGCYLNVKRGHDSQAMSCEFVFGGEEIAVKPRIPAFDARVLLNASSGAPSLKDYPQLSQPTVYSPTSPLEETEPPVTTFYGYRLNSSAHTVQTSRESDTPRIQPRSSQGFYPDPHEEANIAAPHQNLYLGPHQHHRPEHESEQPLSFRSKSHPTISIDTEHGNQPRAIDPPPNGEGHQYYNPLPYPTNGPRHSSQTNLPHMTPSMQFQRFQYDASSDEHLNLRSPALRHSQMSTVSSIISKGSIYDDDDDGDEEVDHEMQNILHALKNNAPGDSLDDKPANLYSEHGIDQHYSDRFVVPDITVEDMSKQVMSHQRNVSETSSIPIPEKLALRPAAGPIQLDFETPTLDCPPLMMNESERELQALLPLDSLNKSGSPIDNVSHRLSRASHANCVSNSQLYGSDPSVFIDQELEIMQRELETSSVATSRDCHSNCHAETDTTKDLQSVSPLRPHRYSVGKGPCRACDTDIPLNARGPLKSIHSTTGELLGQWHRQCFRCSFEDCDVKFSKQVSCYAHEDMPYCQRHYHVVNDTICAWCDSGIEGECIENELRQKWHMHCLRCSMCDCMISHDYYNINGYVFCESDAQQIMHEEAKTVNGSSVGDLKVERRKTKLLMC